jgi:aromatic ring-opening dioxygenase catalytic subunit (LigB family)
MTLPNQEPVERWGNIEDLLPKHFILEDGKEKYSCELQIIRSSAWRFYYGDPSKDYSIKFTATGGKSLAQSIKEFADYLKGIGKI